MYKLLLAGLLVSLLPFSVSAANYPCSKGKGGVSHCSGKKFICNDGSTSKSKKICPVAVHGDKKGGKGK